ncbi:MAG: alpha/beta hydrolase fold domain-containing protein [Frankiales bacterium]|nr:alpha/beta hydrolase fold domain-containing protein [Frankiales bacterium]
MSTSDLVVRERSPMARATGALVAAGLRASLMVSPRPTVALLRREFARSGAERAERLRPGAPPDVRSIVDERYGQGVDELLDVHLPTPAAGPLPVLLWTHGGAFVGGSKDEIDYYLAHLARAGLCVVAPRYTLAPAARHPAPARQVMRALTHVVGNAHRWEADAGRVVLAGDSAGAHITAQVAAAVVDGDYARLLGLEPTLEAGALRATVLCCGIYDLGPAALSASAVLRACGWAYSGSRDVARDTRFLRSTAVVDHVGEAFPASFVTVGNADPLAPQTAALVRRLRSLGVEVESVEFDADHAPALGHEYQFDLALEDSRATLERMIAFVRARTA